jgi:hypothetical protein
MLMICWLTCGPRLKRENGSESDARLENEIGTEQKEKHQQESDIH